MIQIQHTSKTREEDTGRKKYRAAQLTPKLNPKSDLGLETKSPYSSSGQSHPHGNGKKECKFYLELETKILLST